MAKEKELTSRRVYVLPQELVDRIVAFQEEKGYNSEVEAVRKLLDEALLHRDTAATIITRFLSRLANLKMPAEVSRDVLVGHPLVKEISFMSDGVRFTIENDGKYEISENSDVRRYNAFSKDWESWSIFDDELPF
ncbi:hypothetical protein [Brucella pituitosa]|uniref:hypothetical protein n=1 Tax=Brucella pituitosa TaxID=571256 RepID=UPI0009A1BCAD|nr:hypothetical protein [Brucella pituitosa]